MNKDAPSTLCGRRQGQKKQSPQSVNPTSQGRVSINTRPSSNVAAAKQKGNASVALVAVRMMLGWERELCLSMVESMVLAFFKGPICRSTLAIRVGDSDRDMRGKTPSLL